MSSILKLNLKDRQEIKALPKDEYELQITRAEAVDLDQGNKARIQLICEVVGEPAADSIYYTLWYPNEDDSDKQRDRKINYIANFMESLGLDSDVSEIDLDDWIGSKFDAILDIEEYEGTERNRIKKVVKGR